jgi:hypothetical protein
MALEVVAQRRLAPSLRSLVRFVVLKAVRRDRFGESGIPAEAEHAGDHGLVAADRDVGADLEFAPPARL